MPLKYTIIQHKFRTENSLTMNEYTICDMVYHLSTHPGNKMAGWCYMSRGKQGELLGISRRSVISLVNKLIERGFLIKNKNTDFLKTTSKWNGVYFLDENTQPKGLNNPAQGVKKVHTLGEESSHLGVKKVHTINIIDNNTNSKSIPPHIFYENELSKHKDTKYQNFVNFLFGKNRNEEQLTEVLKLTKQVSFKQYQSIQSKAKAHKIDVAEILLAMENKPHTIRKNKSLPSTLHSWIDLQIKNKR